MKLLTRATTASLALVALLAGTGTPASAIVDGQDATRHYPGMAALSVLYPGLGTAKCGGSLIAPRWVLTAAHCVSELESAPTPVAVPGARVTMRIGSTDRTTGGVVATGRQVYLHPDWMWLTPTGLPISDLALVELTSAVQIPLMPIATRQVHPTDPLRLIGWGLTEYPPPPGTTIPETLQQRDTTRLPAAACQGGAISAGEICTSPGACFGDSGGPALRQVHSGPHGRYRTLASVGIAGRETDEATPCAKPIIYTDPTYVPFRRWIRTTLAQPRVQPCTCPTTSARTTTTDNASKLLPLIVQ